MTRAKLLALSAIAPLAFASQAFAAEDGAIATAGPETPATVEELVINPGVTFRDRTDSTAPVLVYDQEYFQRFVLQNQDHMSETELARKLGVSRKCLWERRQRFGIPRRRNVSDDDADGRQSA